MSISVREMEMGRGEGCVVEVRFVFCLYLVGAVSYLVGLIVKLIRLWIVERVNSVFISPSGKK